MIQWFKSTLFQKVRNPDSSDRFARLHLVAYLAGEFRHETKKFAERCYPDEKLRGFDGILPFYEWSLEAPKRPVPLGAVCMDFTCESEGGEFSFGGFWQAGETKTLTKVRLTMLTKLSHFEGYLLSSKEERKITRKIRDFVAQREYQTDESGYYVNMNFLEFRDANHL